MKMSSNVVVNGGGGSSADVWSRGTKRGASDSNLSGDLERFEKRLRLLSIRMLKPTAIKLQNEADFDIGGSEQSRNGKSKRYTPVSHAPAAETANGPSHADHMQSRPQDESMQLDDTSNRVYIHDLDAELADIESDEDKLVFLPDIEKKFTKIPHQVLSGGQHESQELVLYSVPESITATEGHDSVRRAIIESRQRAREKAIEDARHADMNRKYDQSEHAAPIETAHGYSVGYEQEPDSDAMDVD